jgi:hypothetical protein
MTQPTFDFTNMFDTYREAFAPVLSVQQNYFNTLERFARYQFKIAGDYLEWSLAQARVNVEPKSVADLVTTQTSLNTAFGDRLRARAEEFTQITSETEGAVSQWLDEAGTKAAEAGKAGASRKKAA